MQHNFSQRFIFAETDIRGELVQLGSAFEEVLSTQAYPEAVQKLLGEFLVASLLLGSTIKYEGRLILQVKSDGAIPLLMVEASHDRKIRGIVRLAENVEIANLSFAQLFENGSLAVTIDPIQGERYQSLVPLDGDSLAACLESYFVQSEQLNTSITLSASINQAAGMLLQQLPRQLVLDEQARSDQWQHVSILAGTVEPAELLDLAPEKLLRRLFNEDKIKLLDKNVVHYECSCSEARIAGALISLDPDELEQLFTEAKLVEINCEFCQHNYAFTRESMAELLRADNPTH